MIGSIRGVERCGSGARLGGFPPNWWIVPANWWNEISKFHQKIGILPPKTLKLVAETGVGFEFGGFWWGERALVVGANVNKPCVNGGTVGQPLNASF